MKGLDPPAWQPSQRKKRGRELSSRGSLAGAGVPFMRGMTDFACDLFRRAAGCMQLGPESLQQDRAWRCR